MHITCFMQNHEIQNNSLLQRIGNLQYQSSISYTLVKGTLTLGAFFNYVYKMRQVGSNGNVNGIQRFYHKTVKKYVNRGQPSSRQVVNNGQNLVNVVKECFLSLQQAGFLYFCGLVLKRLVHVLLYDIFVCYFGMISR